MTNKKITIEGLATITYKGFKGVDERFDKVDERFDKVDRQIGELTEALTKFIKATDDNFRHVNARLDRVRDDISDVPTMREELHELRERVGRIERKVSTR